MEQTYLNAAWRGLITELLQLPANYCRPANQNAPAGGIEDKFMTVLIGAVTGQGGNETRTDIPNSPDLLFTMQAQRRATATIQAFGEGAFDLLLSLNALLEGEWGVWQCQQANVGLVDRRGPSDLTTIIPALLWQRRAVLAVDFNFIITAQVRVPCFSSFEWSVFVDEDGEAHFEWQVDQPFPRCPLGGRRKPTWQYQFQQ